jgi:hypothetical protein
VRALRRFGHFWYDFIVGDDWTIALAVVVSIAVTAFLAHHGTNAWWLLPVAVAATLTLSVRRVAQPRRSKGARPES